MNAVATIVVLDPDGATAAAVRDAVRFEADVHVRAARDAAECATLARDENAVLVIVARAVPEAEVHAACRSLRAADGSSDRVLVRVTDPTPAARDEAVRAGFDGFLDAPVAGAAATLALRSAVRIHRMQDELARLRAELETLREPDPRDDEVVEMLIRLLETGLPEADERGRRTATLAGQLAARFGVPEHLLRDLETAARLRELGRLAAGPRMLGSAALQQADWAYAVATRSVLQRVGSLSGVAEIVGALYEHWDGTGHPEHWIAGQIPLRSRILRVVADYVMAFEHASGRSPEDVVAALREHAGTRYDPMVLVHLESLVQRETTGGHPRHVVPVPALRAGMVLAEDLYTDSGLKLLSRGTTITAAVLETILRRHQMEPIVHGAAVFRDAA